MQTILGANGIIATLLAKELAANYTKQLRLVSRHPKKVNPDDELVTADLRYRKQTEEAVAGSEIVYLTVGLPYQASVWKKEFPLIMSNVIEACKKYQAKLVFFDNAYMYGPSSQVLTEKTPFNPQGTKEKARAETAQLLLNEIDAGRLTAMICRAPEFYGPPPTVSGTNATILNKLEANKPLQVMVSDTTLRTLIFVPDAARATALLANTPDAFNQTWHLPCDQNRLTTKQFIKVCEEVAGKQLKYNVLSKTMTKIVGLFVPMVKELRELLHQWEHDYLFDSSKFKCRFPDFNVTPLKTGITQIIRRQGSVTT